MSTQIDSMPARARRRRALIAVVALVGAILGLLLTLPIGSTITDCLPGATDAGCGGFDQSILIKTRYPYPHWIPIVGTVAGALVLGLIAYLVVRRRR